MSGDGGYEGQYTLDKNRPMVVDIKVWGHVTNPVEYEDNWVRSFAEANGGLAPIPENKDEAEEQQRLRRSYMRPIVTRGEETDKEDSKEPIVYDDKWYAPVDSIAGLYVNYMYSPKVSLEYNCLRPDTLMYQGQTEYKIGKIYGTKTLAQINKEIDQVLLKKFGEGLHPADAEPADSVSIADVWYVTRLLDGFVIDTNIPEIKKIVYGNDYEESVDDKDATALEVSLNEDDTSDSSFVDAWNYAVPHLKLGAWSAILTVSSNAYGATGVTGSSSSSSYSNYYDYYNYYNYYNSYYGNSYYNNYYNNYYGGMGGMYGGYGGYGNYYNNYYDSYYYNNMYNNSYGMETGEEDTTSITTEVLPYSPMIWQVYVEPRDKEQ